MQDIETVEYWEYHKEFMGEQLEIEKSREFNNETPSEIMIQMLIGIIFECEEKINELKND